MIEREMETSLENLVRIGTVTRIDRNKRMASVLFRDTGLLSGMLPVLSAPGKTDEGQVICPWMPKVNTTVLCLYLPGFNMDGFILGEVGGEST